MKRLLNAGLTPDTPLRERTKVFLLNRLILISLIVNLLIFIIDMILGVYINGFANLVFVLIYYPLFALHQKGKYVQVRSIYMIAMLSFITLMSVVSIYQQRWTETENILYAAFPAVIYLYDKKVRNVFVLVIIILLYGLKYYKTAYLEVPFDANLILTYVNTTIAVAVLIAFSISFKYEFTNALENTIRLNEDLSNQKDKLEENEAKLVKMNKTKNKLFSIVAHDLKNPLNLLNGLVFITKNQELTREELDQYAEMVQKNLGKVNLMMDNVLVWAKAQLKEYSITKNECKLKEIVGELLQFFQDTIDSKKIDVQISINEDHAALFDQNLLKVIVRNVMSNAIKYTPVDGSIKINSSLENNAVLLSINDSGIGMEQESIDKILQGDFTDSQYGTDGETGSGLGLVLSIEMLRLNEGELSIKSRKDKGTQVDIHMPKPN